MVIQTVRAVVLACCLSVAMEMPGAVPGSRLAEPVKTPWRSTKRTEGQTHWQSVTISSNVVTRKLTFYTNSFVELGAGLNVPDAQGQFIASDPSFVITKTGAEATAGAHHVFVPSDIGGGDGIKVVTPKGDELVFQPLLVDYYDPVDGRSILLDSVTNATGWLVASNEIVFSNCFTHLKASIRLRNTQAGLESDLILHERPPSPESFGLSTSARLEMLTEQVSGADPIRRESVLRREPDPARQANMVEPDFTDAELNFNGMRMIAGRAFATPASTNSAAGPARPSRVGKSFLLIDHRRILIEAVEHRQVKDVWERLPVSTNGLPLKAALPSVVPIDRLTKNFRHLSPMIGQGEARAAVLRPIKAKPIQQAMNSTPATETGSALLASTAAPAPAFILDYQLVSEYGVNTDFTFRGDTTYWVSSYDMFGGTTTVEGGTVVKFSPSAGIFVYEGNPLVFDTTNHLPAVFTSYNDNSVGEVLPGSTGSTVQIEAYGFYFAGTTTRQFENVRFTHLAWPITIEEGAVTLRHVQMRDAAYGVYGGPATIKIFNGLFNDCAYVYGGGASFFAGEHLTVHNAICLGQPDDPASSIATLTNSLLVAVQYPPSGSGTYAEISASYTQVASASLTNEAGVFATVEGGGHYLADDTHRNTGTASIDAQLKAVITNLTTYAPVLLTGSRTNDLTLIPRAIRDTNGLDRGYHYPVVDYATKGWIIEDATVTVSGGVVLAAAPSTNGASLWLSPGKLVSLGTPTRLNQFLRLNQVQETNLARVPIMLSYGYGTGPYPELRLRFTEFSSLSGEQYLLYLGNSGRRLEACHSSFFNGSLAIYMYDGIYQTIGLTNNVFRSVTAQFGGNSDSSFYCYNNLFKDGLCSLSGGKSTWIIKDNVFDRAVVSDSASSAVVGAQNAYVAMTNQLTFDAAPVPLTNLAYASGPLGRYYLAGTNLQNAGSRTAAAAGLWHFTTTTNQVRETNSVVDIGFHYVAVGSAGNPVDTDGDGLADYAEDANGNGVQDSGETSLLLADTDNDGLLDGWEVAQGWNPLSPNSPRAIYEAVIASQNPTHWFKLNDGSLTNAISGQPALTNNNAIWDVDAFATGNNSIQFNGTNQRLTAGDVINGGTGTNQGSLSLLFRSLPSHPTNNLTTPRYLFSQRGNTTNELGLFFEPTNAAADSGSLKLQIGGQTNILLPSNAIVFGTWYYLAMTWNESSNRATWYLAPVGGTLISSNFNFGATNVVGNSSIVVFGNRQNAAGNAATNYTNAFRIPPGNGALDQIAFWNRQLSASEFNEQFNTLGALFQGPAKAFDLSRWNILLPINSDGQLSGSNPLELSTGWLNSGFKYIDPTNWTQKYFYLSNGTNMVFEAPWNGARTTTSSGARSELRETKADGSKYNWLPLGTWASPGLMDTLERRGAWVWFS